MLSKNIYINLTDWYLKNVIQLNNEIKNTIHYADFTQFRHINECSKKKKTKISSFQSSCNGLNNELKTLN